MPPIHTILLILFVWLLLIGYAWVLLGEAKDET